MDVIIYHPIEKCQNIKERRGGLVGIWERFRKKNRRPILTKADRGVCREILHGGIQKSSIARGMDVDASEENHGG